MNRRNFLASMLAACAAPAIIKADSLMQIARPTRFAYSEGGLLIPDGMMLVSLLDKRHGVVFSELMQQFPYPGYAHFPEINTAAELHGYRVELSDGCKMDGPLTSNIRVCTGDTVRLHLNHYAG